MIVRAGRGAAVLCLMAGVAAGAPAQGPRAAAPAAAPSAAAPVAGVPAGVPASREGIEAGIAEAVELRVEKRFDAALDRLAALESAIAGRAVADQEAVDLRAEIGYQRGLVLEESGRLDEAAGIYEGVARGAPMSPAAGHAQLSLAAIQARLDKVDESAETYRQVLSSHPRLASAALLGSGALEEKRGRPVDAARAYRAVIRNFPSSGEVPMAKDALKNLCARITSAKPGSTILEEIVATGECLMDSGRAPEAEALYESALKRRRLPQEDKVMLLMALGQAMDSQDRFSAAERVYRRVVRTVPKTPEAASAQMAIVQGFLDRGRLSDAARELERIVKAYPGTRVQVQAQFEAGSVYEAMRQPEKAEEAYRKVLDLAPQSPWGREAQRCMVRLLERGP